ncbi:hypothetical protein QAD02_014612 [Eretmocerus hayati]|uniref:Uncharacterized protein n=2 Tax=Eretmocerus hayati TaxID=131215 RepID=A0ACC2PAP7_9HYME|nr:hypothetical protein QAD02_014611 [Eretmocerus hayati]KAJ8678825.1 hypothetical protein QAD02_014612 [Eretmocerus hayati]
MKKAASTKKNVKGFAALSISKAYGRDRVFHTTLPRAFVAPNDRILGELEHSAKFITGPLKEDDYGLIFSMATFEGTKPPAAWLDTPATVHKYFDTYEESQSYIKKLSDDGVIHETRFGPQSLSSLLNSVDTTMIAPTAISTLPVISIIPGENTTSTVSDRSELADFLQTYVPENDGETSEENHITLHQVEYPTTTTLSKSDVSGFESRVMAKLDSHDKRLVDVETKLSVVQKLVDDVLLHLGSMNPPESLIGMTDLTKKYDFEVPFRDLVSFQNFDDKLIGEMFQEFKTYLMIAHLREVEPTANCLKLFHFIFTKEVLRNCTPVQKSGTKLIFKRTKFFTCLLEAFTSLYFESKFSFSEETLIGFLKVVMKNVGDWGKGRVNRMKSMSESEADDSPTKKQKVNHENETQARSPLKTIPNNT